MWDNKLLMKQHYANTRYSFACTAKIIQTGGSHLKSGLSTINFQPSHGDLHWINYIAENLFSYQKVEKPDVFKRYIHYITIELINEII